MTAHNVQCGWKYTIKGERRKRVLGPGCDLTIIIPIRISPQVQTSSGKKWTVNLGAVLGEMSTGGGLTQLNSTLALMDVPGMQKRMYTDTEKFLGTKMCTYLAQSMQKVAEEKKRHAIKTNSFHQEGIPSMTVVVDGGWSKRSHKHSYNAKSGVAVIFGNHTRKLLFNKQG